MAVGHVATVVAIEQVVRNAAAATGVDFGFLMRTAKRESGCNAEARAPTSSAAGLFQFVEQTWLATVKRHGAAHGYARYAALIAQGGDGRFYVPGGETARRTVTDLRFDPHAASVMAGELASEHAAYLRGRMGREPTGGDLYAAHFLGPSGSARLIDAVRLSPTAAAAALFPDAALSNRTLFYRGGRAVSVAELYAGLTAGPAAGGPGRSVAGWAGRSVVAVAYAVAAPPPPDPGESAFMQYAGAGRLERIREQEAPAADPSVAAAGSAAVATPAVAKSMFASELLSLMSSGRTDTARTRGARSDVTRSDVTRSDVTRSDVTRSDVTRSRPGAGSAAQAAAPAARMAAISSAP